MYHRRQNSVTVASIPDTQRDTRSEMLAALLPFDPLPPPLPPLPLWEDPVGFVRRLGQVGATRTLP